MTTYHFYHYDGKGYAYDTIEAPDDEEAYYGTKQLGLNVMIGFFTSKAEADEALYCRIHDCQEDV